MGRFYPPVRVARSNIFQLTGAWFCIVVSVQNDAVRTVGIAGWPGLSLLSAVMPEGGTMFGVVSWHQLKIRRSLRPQHNTNVPRSSNRITRTRQWMVFFASLRKPSSRLNPLLHVPAIRNNWNTTT